MEPDTRQPDTSTRLRLVDVRFGVGESSLYFGGGLAGVLTEPSERSAAALRIVTTVMGPRPAESAGSVDVGGRVVSVHSLPALLLPPSAPAVLDRDDLSAHWQAVCARRRGELAATHASRRLERHRVEAALERARNRDAGSPDVPAAAPVVVAVAPVATQPSFEALALADAWDAHTELMHARSAAGDIEAAEQRVNRARIALAQTAGGVTGDLRSEIDDRHRDVVEAEARLFEARRKTRAEAVAIYDAAVAAENEALANAGVDSYAAFLVAMTGGQKPRDTTERDAAQQEFRAASTALDATRRALSLPENEVMARSIELRAHAERLLGHVVVGGDPPAELRALRVPVHGGTDTSNGAVESSAPQPATRSDEIGRLEQQQRDQERALDELEAEIARLDGIYDADIKVISGDDIARVMESLLDSYRAGNLLGGRLPVVLDGALDGLGLEARRSAVAVLAAATDVQSIVVTDDLEVMKNVTEAGGTVVLWPDGTEKSDAARVTAAGHKPSGSGETEERLSRWTPA